MRLRFFVVGALLWVMLAVVIYAMTSRAFATGVTLSIVSGENTTNEDADISCVISNGTSNVISFFKVYDDGFGCSLEWQSGTTWCATGRDIVKLSTAEVYSFKVKVPMDRRKQRLSIEYWNGEPLDSAPMEVKSEPFICVTNNCGL